jgi:predicted TIM-barrel fold metal-dependent hydrolase
MATIYANDAVRIKVKKIIVAHGIMDGHAHHNSGACCPMPLIYAQLEEGTMRAYPTTGLCFRSREWCETAASLRFKEGVHIQKLSTLEMGNRLAKMNLDTFANISHSMDFADEVADNKGDAQVATPMIIATMDMERAHIAGYEGQTIYHEEDGKLFYFERMSGDKPEREGVKRNLSHEILVNKVDKTKVLKLKKWAVQFDETQKVAVANPLHMLPLFFYDPRRLNRRGGTKFSKDMVFGGWDAIFDYIATESKPGIWAGVKMYPSLGHKPLDELCEYLPDFYHRCEKEKVPILTHCSPGGMTTHEAGHYMAFDIENGELCSKRQIASQKQREKITLLTGKPVSNALGYPRECCETTDKFRRFPFDYFFKNYVHPEAWRPVLENFPDLHLCLAHFGGDEWRRGPLSEWTDSPPSEWIKSTIDLTKKYKNVYTDIACFNLDNKINYDTEGGKKVRNTFNKMLYWMRDRDEYRHLRNKVIFGTDWYLTHLTRDDDGAEYGNYCRDFKKLIDQVDSTFWIRFTLVNPWECYSMSKEKLRWMAEALKTGGAKKNTLQENLNQLLKLDDEVCRIKEQLAKWDS